MQSRTAQILMKVYSTFLDSQIVGNDWKDDRDNENLFNRPWLSSYLKHRNSKFVFLRQPICSSYLKGQGISVVLIGLMITDWLENVTQDPDQTVFVSLEVRRKVNKNFAIFLCWKCCMKYCKSLTVAWYVVLMIFVSFYPNHRHDLAIFLPYLKW